MAGCASAPEILAPPPPPPAIPASVTITAPASEVAVGTTMQLTALVLDSAGKSITAPLEWSSSNLSIFTISDAGVVTAVSNGTAIITVLAGTQFASRLMVATRPVIALSKSVITFGDSFATGAVAGSATVAISNGGTGSLTALSVDAVQYPVGTPDVWLTATLNSTTSPATLELRPSAGNLAPGVYSATVRLTSSAPGVVPSAPLTVTMKVGNIAEVRSGDDYSCARTRDGQVACWGKNDAGQLGDGTTTDRSTPVVISAGFRFKEISVQSRHSCALSDVGTAYCWGDNASGQLGDGTTINRSSPTPVLGAGPFLHIAVGLAHSCAVQVGGSLSCWGANSDYQLGTGNTIDALVPGLAASTDQYVAIAAAWRTTCAINATGVTRCWGANTFGEGGGGGSGRMAAPTPITSGFVELSGGGYDFCARTDVGVGYCWGSNHAGQLGDGTQLQRNRPLAVTGTERYLAVDGASARSCFITTSATLYCTGFAPVASGPNTVLIPTPVTSPFAQASVGESHVCGVTIFGTLRCFGLNSRGQLGDGSTINHADPRRVTIP